MKFSLPVFILASSIGYAQDQWKDVYRESAWQQRDTWQRTDDIIELLDIIAGSKVADIGCHEGYFTVKLAAKVGEEGKVYAVDISRDKIERLNNNLAKRKITNVIPVLGEETNPKLPVATLHAVLIVDTYHEMKAHDEVLKNIKMSLRPGGRLVICEPVSDERKKSARSEQEKKHELGLSFAREDVKKAGFKVILEEENFVDRTKEKGDRMWILVAEK